jgi:hypothetical protein
MLVLACPMADYPPSFHAHEPRGSSALYCELRTGVVAKFLAHDVRAREYGKGAIEPKQDYPADSAEAVFGKIPMLAAATLSRFAFFTKYMASSAKCSKPSLVRESTG